MIGVALKCVYLVFVLVCVCVWVWVSEKGSGYSDDVCAKPLIKTTGSANGTMRG